MLRKKKKISLRAANQYIPLTNLFGRTHRAAGFHRSLRCSCPMTLHSQPQRHVLSDLGSLQSGMSPSTVITARSARQAARDIQLHWPILNDRTRQCQCFLETFKRERERLRRYISGSRTWNSGSGEHRRRGLVRKERRCWIRVRHSRVASSL